MTPTEFEIVKRTPLDGERVVVTAQHRDPHAIRQFRTFVVLPMTRFAQSIFDSVSVGAALHEHARLVRLIDNKRTEKGERS